MHFKEYLLHLYDYSYWANRRYFNAAQALTAEQLISRQGHSWDSVYRVLLHMMSSEWMWLERWNGNSPQGFLEPQDYPTLASIRQYWDGLETRMRAFIEAQSEESLEQAVGYTNTRGETFRLPLWQMMVHVANHNTHHRGELAAMFALLDAAHPEEEAVQYFLDRSGQKKF
jgi:uncharacterized damage-inducible protein DinB